MLYPFYFLYYNSCRSIPRHDSIYLLLLLFSCYLFFLYPIISWSLKLVKLEAWRSEDVCPPDERLKLVASLCSRNSRFLPLLNRPGSLVKQRWLAPVRRPLTFSATSSGQFYLTPDQKLRALRLPTYVSSGQGSRLVKLKAKVTYVSLLHLAIATSLA